MPRWARWPLFAFCLNFVLFLWIPPLRSEADAPPPPLVAKPATVLLLLTAVAAAVALPAGRKWKLGVGAGIVLATIAAWALIRMFLGGYLPG
jgi:hypothetical protein